MKFTCILLIATFCTMSALAREPVPFEKIVAGKKFPSAKSPADCLSHGGQWKDMSEAVAVPQGTFYTCVVPTSDAGRACSSSSQCESLCELAPGQDPDVGDRAKGRCMDTFFYGGCRSYVHKGRFGTPFCSE